MAKIVYQTDKWGNKEGSHHIEFEVNGHAVQIYVDDSHVQVISSRKFKEVDAGACNSVHILPDGSVFNELYQYHVYRDKVGIYGEEEAVKMALKTNLAKAREEAYYSGDY